MRARLFGSRRRKVASLAVICLLAFGGCALAAWLISGSANFGGTSASLTAPSVTIQSYPDSSQAAWPGGTVALGTNGSLLAHVVNTNHTAMYVKDVHVTGDTHFAVQSGTCDPANFSLDEPQLRQMLHDNMNIAPDSTGDVTLAFVLHEAAAGYDNNDCQGAHVNVTGVTIDWTTDVNDRIVP